MIYTAVALAFLLVCVAVGCRHGGRFASVRGAAFLAAAMVVAQFAVLLLK